jgi:hypothetical protein
MRTQFPLADRVPPQAGRTGGLFTVAKETATIIVRTMTAAATAKNQRLVIARS